MKYLSSKKASSILAMVLSFYATQCFAVNWSTDASLDMKGSYKDNVLLEGTDEVATTGIVTNPAINLVGKSAVSTFDISADVRDVQYNDHPELRQDDGVLDVRWFRRLERGNFTISSFYKKRSSIDETLDESVRFSDALVDIYTANFAASWSHQLTESTVFSVRASYDDVEYDEPVLNPLNSATRLVNFVDYEQASITLSMARALDEKNSLSLILTGLQYEGLSNGIKFNQIIFGTHLEFKDNKIDYTYTVAKLSYTHQASETEKLTISYGGSNTRIDNYERLRLLEPATLELTTIVPNPLGNFDLVPASSSEKRGAVYDFSYDNETENNKYSFALSQNREADSTGGLVEKQKLRLDYISRLTERWKLMSYFQVQKTNAETNQVQVNVFQTDLDRDAVSLGAAWRWTKKWRVKMEYIYSETKEENSPEDIEANIFYVSVGFKWNNIF